jgi:hypothetical protein
LFFAPAATSHLLDYKRPVLSLQSSFDRILVHVDDATLDFFVGVQQHSKRPIRPDWMVNGKETLLAKGKQRSGGKVLPYQQGIVAMRADDGVHVVAAHSERVNGVSVPARFLS